MQTIPHPTRLLVIEPSESNCLCSYDYEIGKMQKVNETYQPSCWALSKCLKGWMWEISLKFQGVRFKRSRGRTQISESEDPERIFLIWIPKLMDSFRTECHILL